MSLHITVYSLYKLLCALYREYLNNGYNKKATVIYLIKDLLMSLLTKAFCLIDLRFNNSHPVYFVDMMVALMAQVRVKIVQDKVLDLDLLIQDNHNNLHSPMESNNHTMVFQSLSKAVNSQV